MMYLTAQQFAKEVGLPYHFILKLCQERKLPYLQNGQKKMIPADDGLRTLQNLAFEAMNQKQPEKPAQHFNFRAALRAEKGSCRPKR